MTDFALEDILAQLRTALEHEDVARAAAIIEALRPPDQADLFAELDDNTQVALLPELNPADSADILEKLPEVEAAQLVSALPSETVIRIVDEMEPDEVADLLSEIRPEQVEAVLAGLEDPDEVRPLLLHPDESAGGLMTSVFEALRPRTTAEEAIQAIRDWKPGAATAYNLFVVDRQGHLCGAVNLRQLIVAGPQAVFAEVMDADVISVLVGADREECARLMSRYDLLALPVVDAAGTLLGVVTIDDVVDVLEQETTEDIQRLGGAQPLERPYLDADVQTIVRKRIGWLLLLFLTGTLTGSVLRYFEHDLESTVALAFFVPLLVGTGGNAGSQTTSTIIRALVVGELDLRDALRVLGHELRIALLLVGHLVCRPPFLNLGLSAADGTLGVSTRTA
jgi:magnesium transporter